MTRDSKLGGGKFSRRKALKTIGVASLGGLGATTSATASQYQPRVVRVKGSYDSPVRADEAKAALEELVDDSSSASLSDLDHRATPEFEGDYEIVEYVARVGLDGGVSQYYGASSDVEEAGAHERGREKVDEFETSAVTPSTPPVEDGPEWSFVNDFQADLSDHWGTLYHNLEWYRVRDGGDERNSFRSLIASSDDTIWGYNRELNATHDWGESELGGESIHNAGPDTTHDSGYTVSIGYPSGGSLSWEAGGTGDVEQNLTSGPEVDWEYSIPDDGTSWFYPGSHVVANRANCYSDQKVITTSAQAVWGSFVYELTHNWHITTTTC